jgi:hypothetical protein
VVLAAQANIWGHCFTAVAYGARHGQRPVIVAVALHPAQQADQAVGLTHDSFPHADLT